MVDKKIVLLIFLFFLISLTPLVLSLDISREFSDNNLEAGEEITVKLIVTISTNDEVYVIEENFSEGISIVNLGDGLFSNGKMKWVIQNIQDMNHTYVVTASSGGNYSFTGIYSVDGEDEVVIEGETVLTFIEPQSYCGDGTCDSNETCSNCASDCGACPSNGGDGGGGSGPSSTASTQELPPNASSTTTLPGEEAGINKTAGIVPDEEEEKDSNLIFWIIIGIIILALIVAGVVTYFIIKNKSQESTKISSSNKLKN